MLKCLIALISLLSTAAMAQSVWTWVDELGQRHYSDTPVDGAVLMSVQRTQTFSGNALAGSRPPATPQTSAAASDADSVASYSVLDLIHPEPEETFWNIGGNLPVELAVYPALQANHRIDAILDGERRSLGARSLSLTIPEVWRGQHTLQLLIVDVQGNELMRSAPVTFFVRQASIQ